MKYKSFNSQFILILLIALPAFTIFVGALAILYGHGFHISSLKNYGLYSSIYFLLVFFIWKNTYYEIYSNTLRIRNFGLLTKQLAIDQITGVERVDQTPATSTQPKMNISGLAIQTKAEEILYVSPIKEAAFLVELQKRNPKIKIINNTVANES